MWEAVMINPIDDKQLTEEEFVEKYMKNLRKGVACRKCDERFLGPRSFRIHARSEHVVGITAELHVSSTDDHTLVTDENVNSYSKKKRKYLCKECGKNFVRKFQLKVHMRLHTKEKPYVCKECGKRFAQNISLSRHLLVHTDKESERYVCTECDERFSEKSKFTLHTRLHEEERRFACDQCEKRFVSKKALSEHSGVHAQEKQSKCNLCQARFGNPYGLRIHMRVHSRDAHTCIKCGQSFSLKMHFVRHVRTHLKEESTQSLNSVDRQGPKRHLRTQNTGGKKSYPCKVCGKVFATKKNLVSHRVTHKDKKPFACTDCLKRFRSKFALKYHTSHAVCSRR